MILQKWMLQLGAAALIIAGSYLYGASTGYDKGYTSGVTAGKEALKPAMDRLEGVAEAATKKLNDDTKARNTRITELEQSLANKTAALLLAQTKKESARDKVVTRYVETAGPVQASCGISASTVRAINELIDLQKETP